LIQTAASPHFPCATCQVRDKAICSALNDEELRTLNSISTSTTLPTGGTVFYEGDDSTYLFNVVSGAVRLSKLLSDGRRQITGFLFPGDFLGLSVRDVYAYTAETLTSTTLCRFERPRLVKIMERLPKLEHELLKLASNELAQAQDHLMMLGRKTANERLATVLITLSTRIGRPHDAGYMIDLSMTRGDIADYTGLTTETVSRTLTRLRKEGIITIPDNRSIYIPELEKLERLNGDY